MRVSRTYSKSWAFIYEAKDIDGCRKRHEIGLGSYPAVPISAARKRATELRELIAAGGDPKLEKLKAAVPTFAEYVDQYIEAKSGEWSNAKHRHQWYQTLGDDYCKSIRTMLVSDITLLHILGVLQPIWTAKPETASRLRGRIEHVLNYAKTRGWRDGENPAAWRGNLANVLPKPEKLKTGHLSAMPYQRVPEYRKQLEDSEAIAARALEFLILTACRSGEVLGAQWSEVDFKAAV